jgi:hypothetical protein
MDKKINNLITEKGKEDSERKAKRSQTVDNKKDKGKKIYRVK